MLDFIQHLDDALVLAVNGMHSHFLDFVMWHISGKLQWIPFYFFLAYLIYRKMGARRLVAVLALCGLIILLADQICASLIRPLVERTRPTNPANPISSMLHYVYNYHGGRYGFPSCHAANTMGITFFICLIYNNKKILWLLLWPLVVAYSRMYMGAHYLTDILVGWAVGMIVAYGAYVLFKWTDKPLPRQ